MSCFELKIELGNEAMRTDHDVASALRSLADKLEGDAPSSVGAIVDTNGNTVGHYTMGVPDGETREGVIHDAEQMLGQGESSDLDDASQSSRYEGSPDPKLAAALDRLAANGEFDEQAGDVEGPNGWFARLGRWVLRTDSDGFVTFEEFDNGQDSVTRFEELLEGTP